MARTTTVAAPAFCSECATSWDPKDPQASHEEWCSRKGLAPDDKPEKQTAAEALEELDGGFGTPPIVKDEAAETEDADEERAPEDEPADEERTVRTTVDGEEADVVLDGTGSRETLVKLTLSEALDNYYAAEDRYETAHRTFTNAKEADKNAAAALENAKLDVIEAAARERQPELNLEQQS